jgi:hypothetical protein
MRKLVFVLPVVVLVISCTENQGQSDFYGTWVYTSDDGIIQSKMEYIISASILRVTYSDTGFLTFNPTAFEIFSWENITNEDTSTNRDYPSGFLLGVRSGSNNEAVRLFIHRNKNSLLSISKYHEVYIKQ